MSSRNNRLYQAIPLHRRTERARDGTKTFVRGQQLRSLKRRPVKADDCRQKSITAACPRTGQEALIFLGPRGRRFCTCSPECRLRWRAA